MRLLILLLFVCCCCCYCVSDRCSTIPPSLWCSSDIISKDCGMQNECQRYKSSTMNKPFHLTLLMEGLCPGCQKFIVEQLFSIHKNFGEFVQIEIVPFGNAKIVNGSIECQHGEEECKINRFESCLIDSVQTQDQYLPLIYCIEKNLQASIPFEDATAKCFKSLSVGEDIQRLIQSCLVSKLSQKLQEKAAERTNSVWPDQKSFVPWILFNNVSSLSAQNLLYHIPTLICQSYTGTKKIPYCEKESLLPIDFSAKTRLLKKYYKQQGKGF